MLPPELLSRAYVLHSVPPNGDEVEMGDGIAGESVSLTVYCNTVGEATIGVRCSNAKGQSPCVGSSENAKIEGKCLL